MTDTTSANSWVHRLIPAATFVVGLLIGAALLYASGAGRDAGASKTPGTSGSTPSPNASSTPRGATVITVPAACRDAAKKLQEATDLVRSSVDSVRNFDPDQLTKALRQLETIDAQARPLVRRCADVNITTSPSPSTTTSP